MKKHESLSNTLIGYYWLICSAICMIYYGFVVIVKFWCCRFLLWIGYTKPGESDNAQQIWINRHLKISSIKVLKMLKTSYTVQFLVPLNLNTDKPIIYMSNHQSFIDLLLIYATMLGSIRLIAKKELFSIPFFGRAMTLSGFIPIERADPSKTANVFARAKETLRNKMTLWVFPEGTRSLTGELLPFKQGAFRMAREAGAYIIPVGIVGTRHVLSAKSAYMKRHQKILIRVGKPIDANLYENIMLQKDLVMNVQKEISTLMSSLEG